MEEEKKHIDELIATYLTEGLDKNALAELKAWIAASPENEDYFIRQREVWFSAVSREAASPGIPFVDVVALCRDYRTHTCSRMLLILAGRSECKRHFCRYIRRSSFRIEDKALFAGWYIGLAECRFTNDLLTRFRSR